jgi:hypothetical protein
MKKTIVYGKRRHPTADADRIDQGAPPAIAG